CFEQTVLSSKCSPTDFSCLCQDEAFMEAAAGCQATGCTVKEMLTDFRNLASTNATMAACGVQPRDISVQVIAIPASFGSLAMLMVIVRLVDRIGIRKLSLDWDDYLVLIAVLFNSILVAYHGMGKDLWSLEFDGINKTFLYLLIAEIFYMAAEMFVQLSLLAFYLRIFTIPVFRKAVYVLMGVVVCFGMANTFSMLFQCTPIAFFWESWSGETTGTCINVNLFSWIRAGIEIAIDVAIISLPIPTLLKLQMSWKKKIQVVMVFCVGFTTVYHMLTILYRITIISILRLQSLVQFSETTNPTYDNAPAIYWSILECDMFIICACMPAMRGFLRTFAPSCFGSTEYGSRSGTKGYASHDKLSSNGQYQRQPSDAQHESDVELVGSLSENSRKAYV
ncbi:hypothetical protein P152DRAFT_398283, partial [Eremomyces bilateralis CBS 781.70]